MKPHSSSLPRRRDYRGHRWKRPSDVETWLWVPESSQLEPLSLEVWAASCAPATPRFKITSPA